MIHRKYILAAVFALVGAATIVSAGFPWPVYTAQSAKLTHAPAVATLPHIADANARLSIDPTGKVAGYQVIQDSDGLTYTWNGPSTTDVAGVIVTGVDAGVYFVGGVSGGKNSYTGIAPVDAFQIIWSPGHADWELNSEDDISSDDTTYPWEATWGIATMTRSDMAAASNWTP